MVMNGIKILPKIILLLTVVACGNAQQDNKVASAKEPKSTQVKENTAEGPNQYHFGEIEYTFDGDQIKYERSTEEATKISIFDNAVTVSIGMQLEASDFNILLTINTNNMQENSAIPLQFGSADASGALWLGNMEEQLHVTNGTIQFSKIDLKNGVLEGRFEGEAGTVASTDPQSSVQLMEGAGLAPIKGDFEFNISNIEDGRLE